MDSFAHQVAERGIDHPLPFDTALAGEGRTFDRKAEVAFARGIVAAVAAVLFAVVVKIDRSRRKRRVEAGEHFSRDRTGFSGVHWPYIVRFNGNEAIQIARA